MHLRMCTCKCLFEKKKQRVVHALKSTHHIIKRFDKRAGFLVAVSERGHAGVPAFPINKHACSLVAAHIAAHKLLQAFIHSAVALRGRRSESKSEKEKKTRKEKVGMLVNQD